MSTATITPEADNPNVTRDGVTVRTGQKWVSLDKRDQGRIVVVIAVKDGKARVDSGATKTTLSIRRMHRHSTGWALVSGRA